MFFTEVCDKEPVFLTDEKTGTQIKIIAYIRDRTGKICLGIDAPGSIKISRNMNNGHAEKK